MLVFHRQAAIVVLLCSAYLPTASAVVVGQVDDFEDGTTMHWTAGGFNPLMPVFPPNPPENVSTGGPAGVDDNYLLVTGEGGVSGPGSKLTTFNLDRTFTPTQWAGDYVASGVTGINLDVNNFSGQQLDLRLLFLDPTFTLAAATNASVIVAPGSGWVNVSFDVDVASMTGLGGADVADVMANVFVLRLYHSPGGGFPNAQPTFLGQVGFDNISAVPLPPAILFLLSGIAGLWTRRRCAA